MRLSQIILFLFIAIPFIEIYLLIQVGDSIGAIPTIFLVIMTAIVGVTLLRLQGIAVLMRSQQMLAQGQAPAIEMIEGIALIIGGALLLTPGFMTDTIGFLCLIPGVRRSIIASVLQRSSIFQQQSTGQSSGHDASTDDPNIKFPDSKAGKQTSNIIEGEFIEHDK